MTLEEDIAYLLTCIKHAGFTPAYDAIAKDAGLKDKKAAYDRYRRLTKRYEEAAGAGVANGTALQTPDKKRGRKSTKENKEKANVAKDEDQIFKRSDEDSDETEGAKKKAKTEESNEA